MQVWRLCRSQFAASAFDGEGAKLYGGRWNHKGLPLVYCSATLSLAVLEVVVHHRVPIPPHDFVAIPVDIPGRLKIETIRAADLTADWRDDPAPIHLQEIGSDWLRSLSSLVLAVPSVIVPLELNYLINPLHKDFARITIGPPQPCPFDLRFWR
jgi:RES domain-containing protein